MPAGTPLEAQLWTLLGAVVLPLWLLAGLCDYAAHARTQSIKPPVELMVA